MNIDLKKMREAAEKANKNPYDTCPRIISNGGLVKTLYTAPYSKEYLEHIALANPQTIIELCDMIEKMKNCGNCKHETETGICELDYTEGVCEWNIGLSKREPK